MKENRTRISKSYKYSQKNKINQLSMASTLRTLQLYFTLSPCPRLSIRLYFSTDELIKYKMNNKLN